MTRSIFSFAEPPIRLFVLMSISMAGGIGSRPKLAACSAHSNVSYKTMRIRLLVSVSTILAIPVMSSIVAKKVAKDCLSISIFVVIHE